MEWAHVNLVGAQWRLKSYKKQKSRLLTEIQVIELVKSVLSPFGNVCDECLWDTLIDRLLTDILQDEQWKKEGVYQGGKMLDDVVDTMLCLTTVIGYSIGNAHAWFDENLPNDGHIIGPGSFQ